MSTSRMKGLIHYLRRAVLRTGAGLTDGELLEDFVRKRNDASFEALVERHGPMVWSVCKRSLSNYGSPPLLGNQGFAHPKQSKTRRRNLLKLIMP